MNTQPSPWGQGEELSRSDMRLVRQALRNDWPMPEPVRKLILQRMIDYCDRDHAEGATAPDRTVILAARTIASFAKLTLQQQFLDLARERHEGVAGADWEVIVTRAEAMAEQSECDRATGGIAQPMLGGPGPVQ